MKSEQVSLETFSSSRNDVQPGHNLSGMALGRVRSSPACLCSGGQVMKTYHMYHAETISAEAKLREVERQEGRVKGVSGSGGVEPVFGLRIEERHQRRNAARKMEKMREKVGVA